MKRGTADLPLHYGTVPPWLAERMSLLGGAIAEAIIIEYGRPALLQRLSDPFWFQSLGCVLGMDWHSSGITTSVMNALRKAINYRSEELGVYICGGRGKFSRETPNQLLEVANKTGLNGNELVRHSKLAAKVDNTAVQDGFQLYLHTFIVTKEGDWSVIQQGMNPNERMARRYHWLSSSLRSFMEEPHTSVCGRNQGLILNLTDKLAAPTKEGIMELTKESPDKLMREVSIILPNHHEVKAEDVNLKRLGAALILAHETNVSDMESLLLLEGVGPRTLQSLTLVSEVIHGTPSASPIRHVSLLPWRERRTSVPGSDKRLVRLRVFDKAIRQARLGEKDKSNALKNLSKISQEMEKSYTPSNYFDDWVQHERDTSYKYGGKTVFGNAKKPQKKEDKGKGGIQLSLWD